MFTFVGMQNLNFPSYTFRLKNRENRTFIFDTIRKKFLILTPEEWVRQHTINFLNQDLHYPITYINVEKELKVHATRKRYDVVVFNKLGNIDIIVECKAPSVKITQETFDQIARYNLALQANYLMITNGLEHYYCRLDYEQEKYHFLPAIPSYCP